MVNTLGIICIVVVTVFLFFFLKIDLSFVTQADLKHSDFLPQLPECWDYYKY